MVKGGNHRQPDTVGAAGDFVSRRVEFPAGMKRGQYDLGRCDFLAVHDHVVNWDTTAVINNGDRVIDVDGDVDLGGETGQRFVDRVVDDFVDQMMQAHFAAGTDVHRRP